MAGELIWAFRVMRLPLRDAAGGRDRPRSRTSSPCPAGPATPPRVTGFVAESQRRRIFVNANRIADLDGDGLRLRSWDVDLNPFKSRPGEVLVGRDVIDQQRRRARRSATSACIRSTTRGGRAWRDRQGAPRPPQHCCAASRASASSTVDEVPGLFPPISAIAAEAARLRDLHPSEVAGVVRSMPLAQRRQLAAAMDDERLADLLEELPGAGADPTHRGPRPRPPRRACSTRWSTTTSPTCSARCRASSAAAILAAMDADDADVRAPPALLRGGHGRRHDDARAHRARADRHGRRGAGPHPRARLGRRASPLRCSSASPRSRHRPASYLGIVPTSSGCCANSRAPSCAHCVSRGPRRRAPRHPTGRRRGARAATTCSPSPVCDPTGRLLGAVTVDDVLDRQLGVGWRQRHRGVTHRTRTA